MKIICDFDRTVFDTNRLYKAFDESVFSEQICTIESLQSVAIPKYVFSDAVDYFRTHSQHQFYIVSSATKQTGECYMEYQKEKIELSKVVKMVSEVYVVEDEKYTVIKSLVGEEPVIFIDDLEEHLMAVTDKIPNVVGILVDRENKVSRSSFPIVHSFSEVDGIIKKI